MCCFSIFADNANCLNWLNMLSEGAGNRVEISDSGCFGRKNRAWWISLKKHIGLWISLCLVNKSVGDIFGMNWGEGEGC